MRERSWFADSIGIGQGLSSGRGPEAKINRSRETNRGQDRSDPHLRIPHPIEPASHLFYSLCGEIHSTHMISCDWEKSG